MSFYEQYLEPFRPPRPPQPAPAVRRLPTFSRAAYDAPTRQPLGDPAAPLGDGQDGPSFAAVLAAALQAARHRAPRSSLYFLSSREAPAPRVVVHAEVVTVCNGLKVTDRRRVR